uniref:Uncharacterized protein n=1 Tax=Rhipicephalus zambeziensis TaxID=60191 RepID=A0A224Y507_9ACAR
MFKDVTLCSLFFAQHESSVEIRKFVQSLSLKSQVLFPMPWRNSWKCKMFVFSDIQTCFARFWCFLLIAACTTDCGRMIGYCGSDSRHHVGCSCKVACSLQHRHGCSSTNSSDCAKIIYKCNIFFY